MSDTAQDLANREGHLITRDAAGNVKRGLPMEYWLNPQGVPVPVHLATCRFPDGPDDAQDAQIPIPDAEAQAAAARERARKQGFYRVTYTRVDRPGDPSTFDAATKAEMEKRVAGHKRWLSKWEGKGKALARQQLDATKASTDAMAAIAESQRATAELLAKQGVVLDHLLADRAAPAGKAGKAAEK